MSIETESRGDVAGNGDGMELRQAFYILGLVTLVVTVLSLAANMLAPIVMAMFLWFFVNVIADGFRRTPGIGPYIPGRVALALGALVALGAAFLAGDLVASNVGELRDGLSNLEPKIVEAIAAAEAMIGVKIDIDVSSVLQDLRVQNLLGDSLGAVITLAGGWLNGFVVVLLFTLFLLLDQPYYEDKLRALFPDDERRAHVRAVLRKIADDTKAYVWLMTMVSAAVGVLTYFIADAFGLKAAAFWGFVAFALNYIPTLGSFLGVTFPALFALVQFDAAADVALFVLLLALVQFVAGNLVLPSLTGDRLNMSQFVVIVSLAAWGTLWGAIGFLLAVPLMMVLGIVLSQFDSTRPMAILLSKNGKVAGGRRNGAASE